MKFFELNFSYGLFDFSVECKLMRIYGDGLVIIFERKELL